MNYFYKIQNILLQIIILNIIIVQTADDDSDQIDDETPLSPNQLTMSDSESKKSYDKLSITINDLTKLTREYPAFIKLPLREHSYYTSSGVTNCPLPYNRKNIKNITNVMEFDYFDPKKCKKPWYWPEHNQKSIPITIDTVGKKLGTIVQSCLKSNSNIEECYSRYLNVIESVGLTFLDRFIVFITEVIERIELQEHNVDFIQKNTLFDVIINYHLINLIINEFVRLAMKVNSAFKRYYISTLAIECFAHVFERFDSYFDPNITPLVEQTYEYKISLLDCRKATLPKLNYAVLEDEERWNWTLNSENIPDDTDLPIIQYESIRIGNMLFKSYK